METDKKYRGSYVSGNTYKGKYETPEEYQNSKYYPDRRYPGEEILVDPQGQVLRLRPIVANTTPKKWKIKYASSNNNKSAGMEMDLQKAASTLNNNKVQVDFHTDANYSNRIPTRPYIVDDSNRECYKTQAEKARQRKQDERFEKQLEQMRLAKKLQMLQDIYRRKGIVI